MVDDNTDADEFEYYAQTTVHPHTILEGEPVRILPSSDLLDHDNDNTGFGLVLNDPTLVRGELWASTDVPDGYDTAGEFNDDVKRALADDGDYVRGEELDDDSIQHARERVEDALDDDVDWEHEVYEGLKAGSTDYKAVDLTDRDAEKKTVEVQGETHTTGVSVGSGEFSSEPVDDFGMDTIIAWYGGMAAKVMLRALDVNGGNFARFTDDGEFVSGLFQPPTGWRSGDRDDCKDDGRYPKAVRPPVLRTDLEDERIFISLSRFNGGNGFEANVGRALDDGEYEDFVTALNDRDSSYDDIDYEYDEIGLSFSDDTMAVLGDALDDVNDAIEWHDADGYHSPPESFNGDFVAAAGGADDGDDGGSFDIGVDDDGGGGITDEEREFGEMVATTLAGTDANPSEDVFQGGHDLSGLVAANEGNFDGEPSVENIREVVYEEADHLSVEDL